MFDDFWSNILRYPRYFVTIILGIFFALFGWVKPLLQKPVTAIALVTLVVTALIFVGLTLRGMLGLTVT
ncbi:MULTISPECIES: DUF751 family protein [Laspinema]|uniref:DUF751 family protein n=1 Tax=Laspinema olomoucense D3b TaxID=2953688 RepID=A0ABT2N881_9CYAN|nr:MULTISPECIES: DUF751 family protein [unclassified Laspinema]MCT7956995.1 DUF751 family protein [Laspinema sp. D2c]MCT7959830.1 DUF751 family protein [Laspinema sp. D2b]MCT7973575.1 DUF751 family protein [Laspinema sp. D3d]MCT7978676.1 DUF751 family protein [Laspinema sp. D3b]MCT7989380.1 DUF751 family protein [Laspinema sp. D3a]